MDIISLGKATQALKKIEELDQDIVAPLAESHFASVDARLDWIEDQATKAVATNSKQVDLSKGTFNNVELDSNGHLQLKVIIPKEGR